jgi:hypothetical protein
VCVVHLVRATEFEPSFQALILCVMCVVWLVRAPKIEPVLRFPVSLKFIWVVSSPAGGATRAAIFC